MPTMEIEYVHHMIVADAADIANRNLGVEPGFQNYRGTVFNPDPAERYERGGLALVLDPGITQTLTDDQIARLHKIGRDALQEAILQNGEALARLILGFARRGENYFDRFITDEHHQGRLF